MRTAVATAAVAIVVAWDVALAALLLTGPWRGEHAPLPPYSPSSSVTDLALLAVARAGVTLALTLGGAPRGGCTAAARVSAAAAGVKLLAIALAAPADVTPSVPHRTAGLRWLLGGAGASLVMTVAAATALACARRAVRARAAAATAAASLEAPLLADGRTLFSITNGGATKPSEAPPALPPSTTVKVLASLAARDAPLFAIAFVAGCGAAVGNALVTHLTGEALDTATLTRDISSLHATLARLAAVAAVTAAATAVRGGLFFALGARLNVRTRRRLFRALLAQEPAFYDAAKTGDLLSRLSADTAVVSDQLSLNLNVCARSIFQAGAVGGFMFAASWRLSVLTLGGMPLIVALSRTYGAFYRRMTKSAQSELALANSTAEEVLSSVPTVRAHAAAGAASAAYSRRLASFMAIQTREARWYAVYQLFNVALPATLTVIVLAVGGADVVAGSLSGGSLISFLLYMGTLQAAIQALGDVYSALASAVGAADKVVELMLREPRLPPAGSAAPPTFVGRVTLENVTFAYPARPAAPVLRGFSLDVAPGETVALVGRSGGGKSSVLKLILRLYAPSSGVVALDGRPVAAYNASYLARRVAVVSQEPVLWGRSVRDNILLGLSPDDSVAPADAPTEADVIVAARLANAHDFIEALPQGYDTECGDRGVTLSGGQKQRIALARALVRRPALLLLDEATSALDAEAEEQVQAALDAAAVGRTTLVVAHRLSTVRGADRIAVCAAGVVAEIGTHDELMAVEGSQYAALVRRQLAGASSAASLARPSTGRGG